MQPRRCTGNCTNGASVIAADLKSLPACKLNAHKATVSYPQQNGITVWVAN